MEIQQGASGARQVALFLHSVLNCEVCLHRERAFTEPFSGKLKLAWRQDSKGNFVSWCFFFFSTFPSKEGSLIHCNSGLEMLQLSLKQRTSSFSSGIPPVSPSPHPTRTLLQVQPQLSPPQLHPPPASRDPAAHPGGSNFFPLAKFVSNTHLPFQTFHMHLFFHFYAGRCLMLSLPFLSFHWNASSSSSPTWSDVS